MVSQRLEHSFVAIALDPHNHVTHAVAAAAETRIAAKPAGESLGGDAR